MRGEEMVVVVRRVHCRYGLVVNGLQKKGRCSLHTGEEGEEK